MATTMANTHMAANRRKEKAEVYIINNEYKRDSIIMLSLLYWLSSKKVWVDKIFAVVMKKRSIDNAVLP